MKYLMIVFVALMVSVSGFAQEEEKEPKEEKEISKAKETVNKAKDRLVFEFNGGILLNKNELGKFNGLPFDAKGFQGGFNVYFMYDVVLKKSPISIAPGIGIGTENWTHNSQMIFTDSFTHFEPFAGDTSMTYKKSKLGLTYIDIPLELRFRSKPNAKNWSWKLAAGFKIGFLIRSKWKYKGEEYRAGYQMLEGENVKFKEFGVPNLEKIRYGVTGRGGFGPFNVHFYYSLSSLFEEGKSIDLQPIVFGISINGL